jgi:hypothetical protein
MIIWCVWIYVDGYRIVECMCDHEDDELYIYIIINYGLII